MTALRDRLAEADRASSRDLALEIGSALTAEPDRDDLEAVLMNTWPVRDWLLGGPDDGDDRRNRRRAARRHLSNLETAAANQDPAARFHVLREPFTWPGPAGFVTAADRYYTMIAGGGDQ